jgi:FtsH-binding integral membrane protein
MSNTNPEGVPALKAEAAKSESWIVIITAMGALLSALTASHADAGKWISFGVTLATVLVYAVMRTPLASEKPGWKTKSFWASIAVVLASVATAVTEAEIPGLPPGVTKIASVIVAMLAALGYTAIRVSAKKGSSETARRLGAKPEK